MDLADIISEKGAIVTVDPSVVSQVKLSDGKTLQAVFIGKVPFDETTNKEMSTFLSDLSILLKEDRFKIFPLRTIEGGLNGVASGLKEMIDGKVSAEKLVLKMADPKH